MRRIELAELKKIQLDILKTVADFCEKNGIRYFLAYGTLLGAVRHKGYIPWDDDIDIMMLRPDYLKFIQCFNNHYTDLKVESHYSNPEYPYTYAKVQNVRTKMEEISDFNYPIGINIDLYPIDGLPSELSLAKRHFIRINRLSTILTIKNISISRNRNQVKNFILLAGKIIFQGMKYQSIIKKSNNLALKYSCASSAFLANSVGATYGLKEIMEKKIFDKTMKMEFEGMSFTVPEAYHVWLTNIYGDYMQMPPMEKRITSHSFNASYIE